MIGEAKYWEAREQEIAAEEAYLSRPEVMRENKIRRLEIRIENIQANMDMIHWASAKLADAQAQLAELKPQPEMTRAEVLIKWAAIMGSGKAQLKKLASRWVYSNWEAQPTSRFSSPEMHEHFCGLMGDYCKAG